MTIAQAEVALRGRDDTAKAFRDVVRNAETASRQIEGKFKTAFKFLAGGFVGIQFGQMIKDAAAAGDRMKTLAERTGRSVESLSQLQYAAERGNTSIEALIKGQEQLAKGMGATDKEGKAVVKALHEIGLEADQIRNMSPDQQLDAIADAMGAVTDPTKRARLELTLFGKAGTELDSVLHDGAKGIRELREESDRLGVTMTSLQADRLAKLDTQLEQTGASFKALGVEIGAIAAAIIDWPLEKTTEIFRGLGIAAGFNISQVEELNREIASLRTEEAKLKDLRTHVGLNEAQATQLKGIQDTIALLGEQQQAWIDMPRLMQKYEADAARANATAAAAAEKGAAALETEAKAAEAAKEAYAKYLEEKRKIIENEKFMNSLELQYPTAILDADDTDRELGRTGDMIEKQAREDQVVLDEIYKQNGDQFKETVNEMSVFAEQGMRNIQGHLADFLFDPFDKGLDGMLSGFVDVIRRMVAEAASSKILDALGLSDGSGGLLGSVLGALFGAGSRGAGSVSAAATAFRTVPALAEGGTLKAGQWGLVGEEGPELAYGGKIGQTIVPFHNLGGGSSQVVNVTVAPVYQVDARGADIGLAERLPAIMREQSNRTVAAAEARIVEGLQRRRYNLGSG